VNKDEICAVGEGLEKTSVTYIKRDEVLGTMKQNMLTAPSLKWQYYATEDGVLFNYPILNYCNDRYDPRFRFVLMYQICHIRIPILGTYIKHISASDSNFVTSLLNNLCPVQKELLNVEYDCVMLQCTCNKIYHGVDRILYIEMRQINFG